METGTVVMMVLIIGLVWGGFGVLLWKSMKADQRPKS
jgi:LPS O-antigen subunit length determinant protein (WzzB/FepE family)